MTTQLTAGLDLALSADYRGARGSNAGDQFHELWALQNILALLQPNTTLTAVGVEGVKTETPQDDASAAWDGVDCALYFGGSTLETADRVEFAQLKYSGSTPRSSWTVAALCENTKKTGNNSVVRRLADAYRKAKELRKRGAAASLKLVSNQPLGNDVAVLFAAPKGSPAIIANRQKVKDASGLSAKDFLDFVATVDFTECGTASRFAQEERAIEALISILGDDIGAELDLLQGKVRASMLPERPGEVVDEHKLLIWFGVGGREALFPCPPSIEVPDDPIDRKPVGETLSLLSQGTRLVLVHGDGGCGKTTLTQQVAAGLPEGSISITFDCYGSGAYRHSNDRRHLPDKAFLQLTNDLAIAMSLPTLVPRSVAHPATVETFLTRLSIAGQTLAASSPSALLLVIIDAADNSITAANLSEPKQQSFVRDLANADLSKLPLNVRFLMSARTARKPNLGLPSETPEVICRPFDKVESRAHLQKAFPSASDAAVLSFDSLTNGNPRVQAYAIGAANGDLDLLFQSLLPNGKTLPDVIDASFALALNKLGEPDALDRLVAALAFLPTPAAVAAVARVSGMQPGIVRDFASDLHPGLKLDGDDLTISDEDFEDHIEKKSEPHKQDTQLHIAKVFWDEYKSDPYASSHVVRALIDAGRASDVFSVLDTDAEVAAIGDPIKRREVQIQRLSLALASCRQANDVVQALKTVLVGAEAQSEEGAFYEVIDKEVDLAVEFSGQSILPRTLLDRDEVHRHGSVMAHCALSASLRDDRAGANTYLHRYREWIRNRPERSSDNRHDEPTWEIEDRDVAARAETFFRISGASAAYQELKAWTPREVGLRVGQLLVGRLISAGEGKKLLDYLAEEEVPEPWQLVLAVPLSLAGYDVPAKSYAQCLAKLRRPFIPFDQLSYSTGGFRAEWLRTLVSACEIAYSKGVDAGVVLSAVRLILSRITDAIKGLYASDSLRLDAILRLWLLERTLSSEKSTDEALYTYAKSISKRSNEQVQQQLPKKRGRPKKNKGAKPTKDTEEEKLRDKLSALFPTYERRLELLRVAADGSGVEPDLASLKLSNNSYKLEIDYEGGSLKFTLARAIADIAFLPNINIAKLYSTSMRLADKGDGAFISRNELLLSVFRLRQAFHGALMKKLDESAKRTHEQRARATDKMEEFIALARFVFPISRADSEGFFNEALQVAKEIDEEAIDQIAFANEAAHRARKAAPGGDAVKAKHLATFAAAAAIPLENLDGFRWDTIVQGLVWLNPAIGLASISRWMDEGTCRLGEVLLPYLSATLNSGQLSVEAVTSLSWLVDGPNESLLRTLAGQIHGRPSSEDNPVAEELARITILTEGQPRRIERARALLSAVSSQSSGFWLDHLRELVKFEATRPSPPTKEPSEDFNLPTKTPRKSPAEALPPLGRPTKQSLQSAIVAARAEREYFHPTGVLTELSQALTVGDRVSFLDAMTSLDDDTTDASDWSGLLPDLLKDWDSPAIRQWSRDRLPSVISSHLSGLARWLKFRGGRLDDLLKVTDGSGEAHTNDVLLNGIAESGQSMASGSLFAIANRIVARISAEQADNVLQWYLERLLKRLPAEDRIKLAPQDAPETLEQAVPRFLFSMMSDVDTRVRWRAAHAARSLVRVGQTAIVKELLSTVVCVEDRAFRNPKAPFYYLGAKLWLMIVAYRLSAEHPGVLTGAKEMLLAEATNDLVPHVVIREYAKRALLNAADAAVIQLSDAERTAVVAVNAPTKRAGKNTQDNPHRSSRAPRDRSASRFHFDETDTVPYWYNNLLSIFPKTTMGKILAMAERWILDVWVTPVDQNAWVKEPRRGSRLSDEQWGVWSHSHGSLPTAERYNTYVEWHAMLCVAGELLKTSPVGKPEWGEDRFESWLERFLPTEPPEWTSDLRGPTPLIRQLWWQDARTDKGWARGVTATEFRDHLLPPDRSSDWIVVASSITSDHPTREEHTRVVTALVTKSTADALMRALQTVSNSWDFGLPSETGDSHDHLTINSGPYQLKGWLVSTSGDVRFDERDPFLHDVRRVEYLPGHDISTLLNLQRRDGAPTKWTVANSADVAFVFETWSDERSPEREQSRTTKSNGWRLLSQKADLARFLMESGMSLICEISVDRTVKNQYRSSYGDEERRINHEKILILEGDGSLRDYRGSSGTWKTTRKRAQA